MFKVGDSVRLKRDCGAWPAFQGMLGWVESLKDGGWIRVRFPDAPFGHQHALCAPDELERET